MLVAVAVIDIAGIGARAGVGEGSMAGKTPNVEGAEAEEEDVVQLDPVAGGREML